eukprot:jgi/Mesen1/2153/ME000152S01239
MASGRNTLPPADRQHMSLAELFNLDSLYKLNLPEDSEGTPSNPSGSSRDGEEDAGKDPQSVGEEGAHSNKRRREEVEGGSDTEDDEAIQRQRQGAAPPGTGQLAKQNISTLRADRLATNIGTGQAHAAERRAPLLGAGANGVSLREPDADVARHKYGDREGDKGKGQQAAGHAPVVVGKVQRKKLKRAKKKRKLAESLRKRGDFEGAERASLEASALEAAARKGGGKQLKGSGAGAGSGSGLGFRKKKLQLANGTSVPSVRLAGPLPGGVRPEPLRLQVAFGVAYTIPPLYDELAPRLRLPTLQDLQIDERVFGGGRVRIGDLAALVDSERQKQAQQRRAAADHRRPASYEPPHGWGASKRRDTSHRPAPIRPPPGAPPPHLNKRKRLFDPASMDAALAPREPPGGTEGGSASRIGGGGGGFDLDLPYVLALPAATATPPHLQEAGAAASFAEEGGRIIKRRRRRRRFADGQLAGGGQATPETGPSRAGTPGGLVEETSAGELRAYLGVGEDAFTLKKKGGGLPLLRIKQGGLEIAPGEQIDVEEGLALPVVPWKSKKDPGVAAREEAEKVAKCWANLVRKDLPRGHKQFVIYYKKQAQDCKRVAELCQREVKGRMARSLKAARAAPARTRRIARDMIIFWKRVDREQAELKKKEEKEALEARKREEELREARRQQQRLNFLLTQTELYSHFMNSKLGGGGAVAVAAGVPGGAVLAPPEAADLDLVEAAEGHMEAGGELERERRQGEKEEGGEDEEEEGGDGAVVISAEERAEIEELKEEARRAAEAAAAAQRERTNAFDSESQMLRQLAPPGAAAAAGLSAGLGADEENGVVPDGAQDIDLLHPSTMPSMSSVSQPTMFKGRLKEYQLKGLQWLVNLYEQGLNGILADEMGLGKTIQGMSLLAHLAEEKNIWGPFLVVAPASVLSNWADEVTRFCPDLKILPYWGGLAERNVLRKNINPKKLYRRDSPFHVLITSYQLLVLDEKYFRRVKWQYMVLDEAQAIKSASSLRWKTLLSFNCRNRLLLSGTPIQNSMAELWALLHFIMPTLFDSHEQFNEWFSKGIEGHAEHGGTLNEHQLTRLHSILKPFMLRRVKRDVESEMTNKREIVLPCALHSRQQVLYRGIKDKISIAELFDGAGGQLNEKKVLHLMNIVIQLRKVCNHPELFERNEGKSYLHFGAVPNALLPPPFGELEDVHYAGHTSLISYQVPKLLYRDGMRCLATSASGSAQGFSEKWLQNRLSIFDPSHIHYSLFPPDAPEGGAHARRGAATCRDRRASAFSFSRLLNLSPAEVAFAAKASAVERWLFSLLYLEATAVHLALDGYRWHSGDGSAGRGEGEVREDEDEDNTARAVRRMLLVPPRGESPALLRKLPVDSEAQPYRALVQSASERMLDHISLLRSVRGVVPPVLAPQVNVCCSDRSFAFQRQEELHHPFLKRLLVGEARTSEGAGPRVPPSNHPLIQECEEPAHAPAPLLSAPHRVFGSSPPMQSFDFAKMLTDSGKLHMLDGLLKQLRAEGHRVLLFAQMTKMLNILEDYMNYRKYKYLRLDGSSTIMDRRDMVKDFQQRPDIFVFLLSTRAGGLGINLTAADTVIFYESDWNPTMDLQAMDRAHRLGQTREVSVYRLICQGTVEEKIVKRANQKNTVQQLVMTGGGGGQGDVFEAEEVQERKKRKGGTGASFIKNSKGVRLDPEGGAVLDDEPNASGATTPGATGGAQGGAPDEGPAQEGAGAAPPAGGPAAKGRKRKAPGEGKPPKPPKAPRVAGAGDHVPRVRGPRKKKKPEEGGAVPLPDGSESGPPSDVGTPGAGNGIGGENGSPLPSDVAGALPHGAGAEPHQIGDDLTGGTLPAPDASAAPPSLGAPKGAKKAGRGSASAVKADGEKKPRSRSKREKTKVVEKGSVEKGADFEGEQPQPQQQQQQAAGGEAEAEAEAEGHGAMSPGPGAGREDSTPNASGDAARAVLEKGVKWAGSGGASVARPRSRLSKKAATPSGGEGALPAAGEGAARNRTPKKHRPAAGAGADVNSPAGKRRPAAAARAEAGATDAGSVARETEAI